ncbi:MAG: SDR family oxidoreductase [Anaerolineae bacterium]
MILVVGASGKLGGSIAARLLKAGKAVRILTRENPDYRTHVAAGAEEVAGDLKDRASLDAVCRGVDTVITTATAAQRGGPDTLESVDLNGVGNLIDAAQAAGVKHFIYISSTGADPDSPNPYFMAKGQNEKRLRESGMSYTILTPHVYLDIWLGLAFGMPLQAGQPITLVGKGDHKHSFIAVEDVASFAIAAVDHPAAQNQQLLLGGPAPVSFCDIAAQVGNVMGKELPVNFVPMGAPIPLIPESLWGFLYFLESYEFNIDMSELPGTYGVAMTSVQDLARQMFLSRAQ